jgi:hypothetical protein
LVLIFDQYPRVTVMKNGRESGWQATGTFSTRSGFYPTRCLEINLFEDKQPIRVALLCAGGAGWYR